jgi:hypothetical protein
MPSWRQGLANGLRPKLPQDLLQHPDAGTEEIAIVVDDLGELLDQQFALFVIQFKVHGPYVGVLTN